MWRSKKLMLAAGLTVVLLLGSIGGIALANGGDDEDDCQMETARGELTDRICEIYEENTGVALNSEALADAFAQAASEARSEQLQCLADQRTAHLQSLVDQGKITREQADECLERMESMPDNLPGFGFPGHHGFFGMGGMRSFGGPCAPME
ncbi:hypothetical protein ACFLUE_01365 [Chloroflexota bacterium]